MNATVFTERPQVAVACGCLLGEAPLWDHRTGTLHWVDIKAEALWRWRPEGGEEAVSLPVGEPVGFVQMTPDPAVMLVGLKSGVARLDLDDGGSMVQVLRPEPDRPGNRLNDASVAPDGSLLFGSMDDGEREPTGRFYRWSADGVSPFGEPAAITNGPAIDAARGLVYCADTLAGRVFRHRLDPDGTPGPREDFLALADGEGAPDGLTVDDESCVWVSHWGGSRVTRYDPEGRALLIVPIPTAQVTNVAFGGPDLATLYVTTAAIGRDREVDLHAGHLFALRTGIRGRPAIPCRMTLDGRVSP